MQHARSTQQRTSQDERQTSLLLVLLRSISLLSLQLVTICSSKLFI